MLLPAALCQCFLCLVVNGLISFMWPALLLCLRQVVPPFDFLICLMFPSGPVAV